MEKREENQNFEEWEAYREKQMKEQKWQEKARKRMNIFSKILAIFSKTVATSAIGIALTVIVVAFVTIYALIYIATPKNVLKSLEELYRGEKFEIIEDFGAKDANSRGLYIVAPKKNKNIQFKMLNTTQVRSDNDYSAQRTKYYIEHCEDQELLQDVQIEESSITYKGIEFLHYTVWIELEAYSEIEETTEKAYKLAKYLHAKDPKMFEGISINAKNFMSLISVRCDTEKSLEEEIYSVKYEYIEQLHEAIKNPALSYDANNEQELQEIGQEEIDTIWKPKYLQLVINGKETIGKAMYHLEDKQYYLANMTNFLKQFDEIEIVKMDMFSGDIKKIKYKDKMFAIEKGKHKGKDKSDVIYMEEDLDTIFNKFHANVVYDYDHDKVYLTM